MKSRTKNIIYRSILGILGGLLLAETIESPGMADGTSASTMPACSDGPSTRPIELAELREQILTVWNRLRQWRDWLLRHHEIGVTRATSTTSPTPMHGLPAPQASVHPPERPEDSEKLSNIIVSRPITPEFDFIMGIVAIATLILLLAGRRSRTAVCAAIQADGDGESRPATINGNDTRPDQPVLAMTRSKNSCPPRWSVSLQTITGPVRHHNEDACMWFRSGNHIALFVADGCGGVPKGREAARIAMASAAASVRQVLKDASAPWLDPECIATRAIIDAARAISSYARKVADTGEVGLRTTLIVVVIDQLKVGYAYIGDGGGVLLRDNGEVQAFLHPQKADGANVLACSLGPQLHGGPRSGQLRCQPGDMLIVGSDGVFDRVSETFVHELKAAVQKGNHDLEQVLQRVLDELAAVRADSLYVFDDNMTLGVAHCQEEPTGEVDDQSTQPTSGGK